MDASDLLAIETLLFTNHIRQVQEDNPTFHREEINWGAWCRHLTGLKPVLARPGWCQDYETKDWNEDAAKIDKEIEQRREAEPEVKAEGGERPLYRLRAAEKLDVFLHANFEWRERRCLCVAYVWGFPEHQYPTRASKGKDIITMDEYLSIFTRLAKRVEREFHV